MSIKIRKWTGAACEEFVVYVGHGSCKIIPDPDEHVYKYHLDSYGIAPKNHKKWGATGYGGCGVSGNTDSKEVLFESMREQEKRIGHAWVNDSLWSEMIAEGCIEVVDKFCPRCGTELKNVRP